MTEGPRTRRLGPGQGPGRLRRLACCCIACSLLLGRFADALRICPTTPTRPARAHVPGEHSCSVTSRSAPGPGSQAFLALLCARHCTANLLLRPRSAVRLLLTLAASWSPVKEEKPAGRLRRWEAQTRFG